ncbi:hypothetical protein ACFOYW_10170 [Gryllotalpicola reticulitermitis]|uniref:Uncharacterized protein n=1 Tax=Gryllotalpicola reticulitermitis TaxID=1184153 RepID=A0ABV8Q8E0_9MICO
MQLCAALLYLAVYLGGAWALFALGYFPWGPWSTAAEGVHGCLAITGIVTLTLLSAGYLMQARLPPGNRLVPPIAAITVSSAASAIAVPLLLLTMSISANVSDSPWWFFRAQSLESGLWLFPAGLLQATIKGTLYGAPRPRAFTLSLLGSWVPSVLLIWSAMLALN